MGKIDRQIMRARLLQLRHTEADRRDAWTMVHLMNERHRIPTFTVDLVRVRQRLMASLGMPMDLYLETFYPENSPWAPLHRVRR